MLGGGEGERDMTVCDKVGCWVKRLFTELSNPGTGSSQYAQYSHKAPGQTPCQHEVKPA